MIEKLDFALVLSPAKYGHPRTRQTRVPLYASALTVESQRKDTAHRLTKDLLMGLFQVTKRVPTPTFYDSAVEGTSPALSSVGAIAGWQNELAFAALGFAYEAFGGLARGDHLDRVLSDHGPSTFVSMTRLFADGEVFGFEWQESMWIPMFQFAPEDLSVKTGPCQVRAELGRDFDGWTASAWFVEPNVWLGRKLPIDLIDSDVAAVLQAARVDRFVAAG